MNIPVADLGAKGQATAASVIATIADGIAAGIFKQGDLLPLPHDVALHFGFNPEEMVRSFTAMARTGKIQTWEAGGTFWGIPQDSVQPKLRERYRGPGGQSEIETPESEARRLGIPVGDVIERRQARDQRARRYGA
jgi:DNA-binding transcriptional regulator YhcF (GntR family)